MGKLLKCMVVLILAVSAGILYIMYEECLLTDQNKFVLFDSYLKRASDPHEKRLRLVENKKFVVDRTRGKLTVTTLEFVEEKYYLDLFTKTYRLQVRREAYVDNNEPEWIEAALFLAVDYGSRKEHDVIFSTRIMKDDPHWKGLASLYDNPVNSVRKKNIRQVPDRAA
ncbi:MAG: hypothetical protein ACXWL9_09930 [Syntrophales bacterium]